MTGFYPHKTGVMANVGRSGYHPLQIPTIGTSLRNSGYQTGYFGKWHLGNNPIPRSGWEKLEITRDGNKITATAKEFLLQQKERNSPFALFLSYLNPHHIYQLIPDMFYLRNSDIKEKIRSLKLPKSWQKETFENKPEVQEEFMSHNQGTRLYGNPIEEWKMYRSFYKKKVRLYDNQVGEILATLRQAGLFENTVIVITSDHGDMDTNHRLIFKGPFMYEHMVRVPLIIRVPRKYDGIGARKVANYSAVLTDIVPTLRDFAKLKNKGSDGHSLKPLLTGSGNMEKRDYIISQYYGKQEWVTPIRMIRTKDWKYNTYIGYEDELYDLRNDPHELNNLIGNSGYKKIRKELSDELNRWMNENEDPFYSYCPTKMNGVAFQ
jgi:arylsulfatase A-like enzyme